MNVLVTGGTGTVGSQRSRARRAECAGQHPDPHFGSKVGVEAALRRSGIPFTILRPNNFYQNDYW